MSKWVTFYRGLFCGNKDFVVHKDKQTAERFYNAHIDDYMRFKIRQKK